jgi:hypothetical protein
MIVNTVEDVKRNFTKREVEDADKARRMYVTMGWPSNEAFELMIKKGKILNTPITVMDYRNALQIYGKDLGCIKGKTTRTRPQFVHIDVTNELIKNQKIVLSVDLMKFTGIIFFMTVARDIKFITASVLSAQRKGTILKAIKAVIDIYKNERDMQ